MKFIKSNVEIIPQEDGLLGVYKQIEKAGRTCYKSEDKITDDSCTEFVDRMIKSGHTATLEHGTIYLNIPALLEVDDLIGFNTLINNPYTEHVFLNSHLVTTNYRVLIENGLIAFLKYMCEPLGQHPKRVTVKFTCDRGVSHELVRHRKFSFCQESTRYCNYTKDKFGNELTYIIPSWLENTNDSVKRLFLDSLSTAENRYMEMLDNGCKAQEARAILPNALKTEVVMTGFVDDWKHFFELRCAPNAHPDMRKLANKLREIIID